MNLNKSLKIILLTFFAFAAAQERGRYIVRSSTTTTGSASSRLLLLVTAATVVVADSFHRRRVAPCLRTRQVVVAARGIRVVRQSGRATIWIEHGRLALATGKEPRATRIELGVLVGRCKSATSATSAAAAAKHRIELARVEEQLGGHLLPFVASALLFVVIASLLLLLIHIVVTANAAK